jgi:hypothetical protein
MTKTHINQIKEEIKKCYEFQEGKTYIFQVDTEDSFKILTLKRELEKLNKKINWGIIPTSINPIVSTKLQTAELYEKKIDDAFKKLKETSKICLCPCMPPITIHNYLKEIDKIQEEMKQ